MKHRTYYGYNIYPYSGRTPYWKWEAFIGGGRGSVYANTLRDLRELIRDAHSR